MGLIIYYALSKKYFINKLFNDRNEEEKSEDAEVNSLLEKIKR